MLLAGVTMLAVASTAAAQPAPPPWVQLNIVQVHPDMEAEFLSVQKEFSERASEAGTPFRAVFRTAQLGDTWKYIIATPMESLAELDDAPEADAARSVLIERVRKCIVSRRSYAVRPVAAASNAPAPGTVPKLAVTEFVTVAPGRGSEYLAILESDILPHFDAMDVRYVTGRLGLGGSPGFVHLFYEDSFAEIGKGSPLSRALGPEGAEKVDAKLTGIVTHQETWVSSYVAEVSYDNRSAGSSNQN
jgi:hypothetical protein